MGMWFLLISAMPQSPQLPTPTTTWHPAAPGPMVGSLLGSVYMLPHATLVSRTTLTHETLISGLGG